MAHTLPSRIALAVLLLAAVPAAAQNYQILHESLDGQRHGYTVMRVWGTPHEMGFALGAAMADDIVAGIDSVKTGQGGNYSLLRTGMTLASWTSPGVSQEIDGIVAGVLSVRPAAGIDATDVKVVNTYGDWAYACRSHIAWGRWVQAPVKTLATRRLDFGTPFDMALHHVVVARDPSDGSPRWVNVAWPGFVTVATGVNVHGTLASLHDYNSSMTANAGVVSRGIASRHVLANVTGDDLAAHLTWAGGQLAGMNVATGTFINFYSPEGHAGVFTCTSGGPCGAPRRPQGDYLYGEAMLTTNQQTTGHSKPTDDTFMDDYYNEGFPKDLESHFTRMGTGGLHVVSVAYRGKADMTIWVNGRGRSDRLELEWSSLYAGSTAADGGLPDAVTGDAAMHADAPVAHEAASLDATEARDGMAETPHGGDRCGCTATGGAGGAWLLVVALGLLVSRRGRSRRCR